MIKLLLRAAFVAPLLIAPLVSTACLATSGTPSGAAETATPVEVDDSDTIPCPPRLVLQTVCQRCHQNPPIRGAPFPLMTRSNILRVNADGEVRQLMIQQLEVRRMPLFPERIDDESRSTLLEWLRAGAPAASSTACGDENANFKGWMD